MFFLPTCALSMPRNAATSFLFQTWNIFTQAKLYSQYWLLTFVRIVYLAAVRTHYWFPICNIYSSMENRRNNIAYFKIIHYFVLLFDKLFSKSRRYAVIFIILQTRSRNNERGNLVFNVYLYLFVIFLHSQRNRIGYKNVWNICYRVPIF